MKQTKEGYQSAELLNLVNTVFQKKVCEPHMAAADDIARPFTNFAKCTTVNRVTTIEYTDGRIANMLTTLTRFQPDNTIEYVCVNPKWPGKIWREEDPWQDCNKIMDNGCQETLATARENMVESKIVSIPSGAARVEAHVDNDEHALRVKAICGEVEYTGQIFDQGVLLRAEEYNPNRWVYEFRTKYFMLPYLGLFIDVDQADVKYRLMQNKFEIKIEDAVSSYRRMFAAHGNGRKQA